MTEGTFSIKKSTVECYKIRHSSGMYWADITIDSKENTGRISIASDYGSWQNYWNACGEPFKKFLIGLNMDYVAGKFGCSKWFNSKKTIEEFRASIIENIDNGDLSKEDGKEAFEELQLLEATTNHDEFYRILEDCNHIMKLYDYMPSFVYEIEPLFKNFWELIWPEFVKEIKHELSTMNGLSL